LHQVKVKPLSVNDAWKGRRFKTDEYKAFEDEILYKLPASVKIPEGKIKMRLHWGFSSNGSDFDNPIKPFLDCLQKKYLFNDNRVWDCRITKEIVPKGQEFIEFEIGELE